LDERRSIPIEAEIAPVRVPRRGTPIWLQILISIAVLAIVVLAWAFFFPGAREMLAARGIALPGGATEVAQAQPQGTPAGAPRANGQAGNPGNSRGQGFARGGGRTAVVVTAPVTSTVINDKLSAIGEGTAVNSVTIIAPANGTLAMVAVTPGQRVNAGDELAALDSQAEQIAFDRAQLAADDAAAALKRATDLRKSNSVSTVDLNKAQLASDQARLELRNAQLALDKRTITSPIAGTVGLLQVTPGNQVNTQTQITTIEDSSAILINFWVPERYASVITTGMPVGVEAVALPGQSFSGEVSAVDNRVDTQSRTLQVQARIANPDGKIRPGMSFKITMSFPGERYAAVDPLAIQWSSEGAYVWKYVDGKVQQAMVTIVERNSDGVLVSGDIAEGDQVVTQGVLQLSAGQSVRLLDDTGAGTGGQGSQPAAAPNDAPQGQGQPSQPRRNGQGNGGQPAGQAQ
jgi:RND family efflux transporter MFP subunit